tara:strand:- start:308 stop:544 length:237 start_codon:yes stop_codon:yes gene_type:complete
LKKLLIILVLFYVILFSALAEVQPRCSSNSNKQFSVIIEIELDGELRQYRLSSPKAPVGVTLPILMAFHGGGRNYPFP